MQEAVGGSVRASTIHRLLGWLPGGASATTPPTGSRMTS